MGEESLSGVVILLLLLIFCIIFIVFFIFRILSQLKEVQLCVTSKKNQRR